MILVYVAGPFSAPPGTPEPAKRSYVEQNIANAVAVGLEVAAIGLYPVIPHANTAHPGFEMLQPYKFWIDGTREVLRRACDTLILVPRWETSSGAREERADMLGLGKPVFESITALEEWSKLCLR